MDVDEQAASAPPPAPEREQASGSLAPVALGLGIAGLLMGLIPFYGSFFALPLSIVAVVLGLTARGRPHESRPQATGGLVTGTLGLLAVAGWIAWMAWSQLGFGSFVSETSIEVESGQALAPPAPTATAPGAPDEPTPHADGPTAVTPGASHGELVSGLSGQAELSVGGQQTTLELTDCALAPRSDTEVLLRGEGPDGRLVAAQARHSGALVLDIEVADGPRGTYLGHVRGLSSRGGGGGLIKERRQFAVAGELRELHSGDTVDVDITATCS